MNCPLPPQPYSEVSLPKYILDQGTVLLRSHRTDYGAIYFNKPPAGIDDGRYRFDAPVEEFGVLYAAETFGVCFAETVLREMPSNTPGNHEVILPKGAIDRRSVTTVEVLQKIRLVDFVNGLVKCRAQLCVATDYPYAVPNQWSLAVWSHPGNFDGIYYPSRFTAKPAIALFDRAANKIAQVKTKPMRNWGALTSTLTEYGIFEPGLEDNPFL